MCEHRSGCGVEQWTGHNLNLTSVYISQLYTVAIFELVLIFKHVYEESVNKRYASIVGGFLKVLVI